MHDDALIPIGKAIDRGRVSIPYMDSGLLGHGPLRGTAPPDCGHVEEEGGVGPSN